MNVSNELWATPRLNVRVSLKTPPSLTFPYQEKELLGGSMAPRLKVDVIQFILSYHRDEQISLGTRSLPAP